MLSRSKHGLLSEEEPQHDMSDIYRLGYDYGLIKVPRKPTDLRPELPIREVFFIVQMSNAKFFLKPPTSKKCADHRLPWSDGATWF